MDEATQLMILKQNLQRTHTTANDEFLKHLLGQAKGLMKREGITDDNTKEYQMAVIDYAAFLFRKRANIENTMPKHLRKELNNILFSQKMKS